MARLWYYCYCIKPCSLLGGQVIRHYTPSQTIIIIIRYLYYYYHNTRKRMSVAGLHAYGIVQTDSCPGRYAGRLILIIYVWK